MLPLQTLEKAEKEAGVVIVAGGELETFLCEELAELFDVLLLFL